MVKKLLKIRFFETNRRQLFFVRTQKQLDRAIRLKWKEV